MLSLCHLAQTMSRARCGAKSNKVRTSGPVLRLLPLTEAVVCVLHLICNVRQKSVSSQLLSVRGAGAGAGARDATKLGDTQGARA